MENIAVHMRISGVIVSDDDVTSRRAAATSLATSWGKERNVSAIIAKAADVSAVLGGDGNPSAELGDEIQAAIQKKSPSFLYEERPLDVSVCAGMAMVSMLTGNPNTSGWSISDVYATALWSSLEYQPVLADQKRERLRREVLDTGSEWVVTVAEKGRERVSVPDPSEITLTINSSNVITSDFKKAISETVEALRSNAALDREELDFLWWAQLGRSRLLNRQLSTISEPTRIISAGLEAAKMLRRLPCEVHREIVLRTLDKDPELDLAEILAAIGEDLSILSKAFIKSNVTAHPTVFPLLYGLVTGETDGVGASIKRRISDWGARALLEAGFSRMISQGAGKV